jgi:transcriptional regulator with XRE-family HTH domain
MANVWDNLTAKQRQVAELIALGDPDNDFVTYSKVEICQITGVARSTLYQWLKNESFNAYIEYLCDQSAKAKLAAYDRALDSLIFVKGTDANGRERRPSVKALELAYKRLGKLKEVSKIDATLETSKSISDLSNDELDNELEQLRREVQGEAGEQT